MPATWMFGTTQKMQMLPAPGPGMTKTRIRYNSGLQFENGGADVFQPYPVYHYEYSMTYPAREAGGPTGLDIYGDYAGGYYGNSLMYFADPMTFTTNMAPANWANPGLIQ